MTRLFLITFVIVFNRFSYYLSFGRFTWEWSSTYIFRFERKESKIYLHSVKPTEPYWTLLENAVVMELADISSSEPPDSILFVKLFLGLVLIVVVANGDVLAADVNFAARKWLVRDLTIKC